MGSRVDLDVDDDGDEGGEEEGDGDQGLGKDGADIVAGG